jgi:hypothetical protein
MNGFLRTARRRSVYLLNVIRSLPIFRRRRLEAKLKGVAGFTGGGAFRYTARPPARIRYELDLKGVAGLKAELWLRGAFIFEFELDNGKAAIDIESGLDAPPIAAREGETVLVRQNGDVILSGKLSAA